MADFIPKKLLTTTPAPLLQFYNVYRDKRFYGYNVVVGWNYTLDVAAFKVYRAKVKKSALRQNYVISNLALERLTPTLSNPTKNTSLYNKSVFSQNEKVKFEHSNSTRYDTLPGDQTTLDFKQIAFIPASKNQNYQFVDRNVKFGETYAYAVSAVTYNLVESVKTTPLIVPVEDITAPSKPSDVTIRRAGSGALIYMSTKDPEDVVGFHIYKMEYPSGVFEHYDTVMKPQKAESVSYIDYLLFPGKRYYYRIFAFDVFGNVSKEGVTVEHKSEFAISQRGVTVFPKVTVQVKEDRVSLTCEKELLDSNIIGVRIEREDAWNFENKFSVKSYGGEVWPNIHFFPADRIVKFDDLSFHSGKIYRYRFTLVTKNGLPTVYFITPYIRLTEGETYNNQALFPVVEPTNFKINDLDIEVIANLALRPLVKISWDTTGSWDYLILKIGDAQYTIYSIHKDAYFDTIPAGDTYKISAKFYNFLGAEIGAIDGATLTL